MSRDTKDALGDVVFWLVWLVFVALVVWMASGEARSHEGHVVKSGAYKAMGTMEQRAAGTYLFGMNRMDPQLAVINCCLYGGNGDCKLVPEKNVKTVPGGYQTEDGEFVPEAEATVSPDENFYRCIHTGANKSHCFFAPGRGM